MRCSSTPGHFCLVANVVYGQSLGETSRRPPLPASDRQMNELPVSSIDVFTGPPDFAPAPRSVICFSASPRQHAPLF